MVVNANLSRDLSVIVMAHGLQTWEKYTQVMTAAITMWGRGHHVLATSGRAGNEVAAWQLPWRIGRAERLAHFTVVAGAISRATWPAALPVLAGLPILAALPALAALAGLPALPVLPRLVLAAAGRLLAVL